MAFQQIRTKIDSLPKVKQTLSQLRKAMLKTSIHMLTCNLEHVYLIIFTSYMLSYLVI